MPRVSVDDMVEAIREADPKPLTASSIAEATGVTQQAISARRDELESDDRVGYGQVGNATAYWLSRDAKADANRQQPGAGAAQGQDSRGEPPEPTPRPTDGELARAATPELLTDEQVEAFAEVLAEAESDRIEAEAREAHSSDRAARVRDRSLAVVELSLLLVVGGSLWLGATALLSTVGLPWAFVYPGLTPLAFGVVGIAGGILGVIRSVWVSTAAERLTGAAGSWLGGQI